MARTKISPSLVPAAQNVLNILYNGGFEIHQNTNSNANNNYVDADYFFDGWKFNKNSNRQMNGGYETGASNVYEGVGSLKADSLSGNTVSDFIFQRVENFALLANRVVTFTVAVKTNTASAVQAFISFSGPGGTTVLSSFHTGGNTFEILTVSTTIGSAPGSVNIGISIAAQSTTYIDAAMAVIGASPVNYIPEDPMIALARCQRYYEKSYAVDVVPGTSTTANVAYNIGAGGTGVVSAQYAFKVTKRTNPTVTVYTTTGTSGSMQWGAPGGAPTSRVTTAITSSGVIPVNGFQVTQTVNNTEFAVTGHWVADARL